MEGIFQSHHESFKAGPACVRRLARNRQPQLQSKIRRSLRPLHVHQQLLRPPQRLILTVARRTLRKMILQCKHLRACHCSVQVWREQPLRLGALQSHSFFRARLSNANHGITSTLLPPPATCDRGPCSLGAVNPSSFPTSRTYGVSLCRRASLPRVSLDFTVPSETSSSSAISSYDISSRSRRISVVRYGSGTCRNSSSTRRCTSRCATLSNGDSAGSVSATCIAKSAAVVASELSGSTEVSRALCRNHHRRRFAASCKAM